MRMKTSAIEEDPDVDEQSVPRSSATVGIADERLPHVVRIEKKWRTIAPPGAK